MDNEATGFWTQRRVLGALLIVWVLSCLPILLSAIPPLGDYPNHVARSHILATWGSNPGYEAFFQPHWSAVPNLAMDLFIVGLGKVIGAEMAAKVFTCLTLFLMALGPALLHRALAGRWSVWGLLPLLVLYNKVFAYGFLNFMFGLGLTFVALAIYLFQREKGFGVRLATGVLVALALFFSHLMGFVLYGFLLVSFEIGLLAVKGGESRRPAWRDFAVVFLSCLPVLVLYVLISPTKGETSVMEWSRLGSKVSRTLSILETGYPRFDLLFTALVALLLVALLVSRSARFDRRMALPVAATVLLFVVAPFKMQSTQNIDMRMPIVFLLLFMVGIQARPWGRIASLLSYALVGAAVLRVLGLAYFYPQASEKLVAVRNDLNTLPAGSIVFYGRDVDSRAYEVATWNPPMTHAVALAAFDSPRLPSSIFSNPAQQPMVLADPFKPLSTTEPVKGPSDLPRLRAELMERVRRVGAEGRPVYLFYLKPWMAGEIGAPGTVIERERYAVLRLGVGDQGSVIGDR